jgi:hypothetical protein
LTVERCNGFRCSLINNVLTEEGGFIRARSLSHALMALSSALCNGRVVDKPPFNRVFFFVCHATICLRGS